MADKIITLNDKDIKVLRQLIAAEARRFGPQAGRHYVSEELGQTPDVFIARTPTDGIPANDISAGDTAGTGTGDLPGYASCDIYRISDASGSFELKAAGFGHRVFNLSDTAITGNTWITVMRDKFGTWLAVQGGGSGSGSDVSVVRVLDQVGTGSEVDEEGYYEGYTQSFDPDTGLWSDEIRCLVRPVQDSDDLTPRRYLGLRIGSDDSAFFDALDAGTATGSSQLPVYVVQPVGSGLTTTRRIVVGCDDGELLQEDWTFTNGLLTSVAEV